MRVSIRMMNTWGLTLGLGLGGGGKKGTSGEQI